VNTPPSNPQAFREKWQTIAAGSIAALLAFVPFARSVLRGESFYFRDLALYFFPVRRFVVEGLRGFEVRFWNPYVHGGAPVALPPIGYPVDLLQVLLSDEKGFSLLLALHFPLAALGFFVLARSIGTGRIAAVGGAALYSLGGFALSTMNLYVYLEALAWAPLVIWGLSRLSEEGGPRRIAAAGALVAVAASTTAVEIVAQTVLVGALLALRGRQRGRAGARVVAAVALGAGLATVPLVVVAGALEGSARAAGFTTEIALAHAVHPMTLLQMVVGGLYGDLHQIADRFWGQNFFPLGFPYFLSLYTGATAIALAAVGAFQPGRLRLRLVGLLAIALLVCLGPWAGLRPVVDALALLRRVRYPSKAFFSVHVSLALLLALGLDTLVRNETRRKWRALAIVLAGMGALLLLAPAIPALMPDSSRWFLGHFFPDGATVAMRRAWLAFILDDAARGGILVMAAAATSMLAATSRLRAPLAAGMLAALVATDLLRAGAGLNPTVTGYFFAPSPQTRRWADSVRGSGRIFTCDVAQSRTYQAERMARPGRHEAWSFMLLAESLTPLFNVATRLPSALSPDLTMLVPVSRVSSPEEASCRDLDRLLPRLRAAGVSHVLSLDPLEHQDLTPGETLDPARVAPVVIRTYAVRASVPLVETDTGEAWPYLEQESHLTTSGTVREPTALRINITPHAGWRATLDGRPATVLSDGQALTLRLPPGHHDVDLHFVPPYLALALMVSVTCALLVFALAAWPPPVRPRGREPR
jgi:hypothetical protein